MKHEFREGFPAHRCTEELLFRRYLNTKLQVRSPARKPKLELGSTKYEADRVPEVSYKYEYNLRRLLDLVCALVKLSV